MFKGIKVNNLLSYKKVLIIISFMFLLVGCGRPSSRARSNCEKIGLERAKSYIRERYGIDNLNITSVIASESGENEIWPDIYTDYDLTGSVSIDYEYKGAHGSIKSYCDGTDEEAYAKIDTYESTNGYDSDNCVEYDDIKFCLLGSNMIDINVSSSYEYIDDNQILKTYRIDQNGTIEQYHVYRVYIPVNKISGNHNKLKLHSVQVRDTENYTSDENMSITSDFKYIYEEVIISNTTAYFTVVDSE